MVLITRVDQVLHPRRARAVLILENEQPQAPRIRWVVLADNDIDIAVDYQLRANGAAEALFIDERGNEMTVTCLVPPFPK